VADKTARTGPDDDPAARRYDPPAVPGATGTAPPSMPIQAASPITSGPPAMPTLAAVAITNTPPAMPTQAAVAITNTPPAMPGAPDALSGTAAPAMPTLAGAALDTSPPAMPIMSIMATMASAAIPQHQAPAMPPARYELGREIARGGMGRVVDASDTMLGRLVAFKEALTTDVDTLRRFQREIRITARLEHPSIVPVHDTGASSNGAPFYVMRKVSGQPLERLVANAETLNQRLALIPHIVASAQAIAHAHERGIVHRDIKPSNILVGDLGETVVIDWGLAKLIGETDEPLGKPLVDLSDSLKTRVGIVYGTPGFMAPEQLRGVPVTPGFDVYALGATLYHLLARKPPHYANTADEMMRAAVAAPPTPIRELVDGVPPDLSTIVDKALAHDPLVRYRNARSLAEDLQRFLTGQLVASHHYSRRDKLVRFIRKNRGVSAAVAALIVVGTISVARIVNERNRADRAAAQAIERAEQLTLAQARSNVEVNPTKSVAMLKPLAKKYWREVRAIAAAARAAGVAWSVPASKETVSLEMSHDGQRALSAGADGVVRVYDLARRTTRPIVDLRTRAMARFAEDGRQIVIWPEHGTTLVLVDPATGQRRDIRSSHPIADLEVAGTTIYWVDDQGSLWQLDLAGTVPVEIRIREPVVGLAPSPDGRWIALSGKDHLFLYDRTHPDVQLPQVTMGKTHAVVWSANSENLAALIDDSALDVAMLPVPSIRNRHTARGSEFIVHRGDDVYVITPNGVAVMAREDDRDSPGPRNPGKPRGPSQLRGNPVGIAEARGKTIVAGGRGGLTVISDDGDHLLPLQVVHLEGVLASPRSPYVIAQLEHRLLLWNLDDIQPRRLTNEVPGDALFATADQVITGGTSMFNGQAADSPAQSINAVTAATQPLGDWVGLHQVTAPGTGNVVALVDGARHVHLVSPGRAPEDLPGEVDIAGFATPDKLVLATLTGELYVHDVARHQRTPLVPHHARLLGLAWGRGNHPWVAAAFADATLWRKNLVTGVEATIARVPAFDPAHPVDRDGKLIVGGDGSVLFLHDNAVHAWRADRAADGPIEPLAVLPKPIDDFGEAGTNQILAIASDSTVYVLPRDPRDGFSEALPSIDGTSASMSPDTGLLAVLDHGAVDIVDPLAHQQWTLAPPGGVAFSHPVISPDGRRVLAQTARGLVVWSIDMPATPEDTATWLDAMTNAVDDQSPRGLGWR
jgi:hypothetical protein